MNKYGDVKLEKKAEKLRKGTLVKGYQFNSFNNRRQRRLMAKENGYIRSGWWNRLRATPENNVQTVKH